MANRNFNSMKGTERILVYEGARPCTSPLSDGEFPSPMDTFNGSTAFTSSLCAGTDSPMPDFTAEQVATIEEMFNECANDNGLMGVKELRALLEKYCYCPCPDVIRKVIKMSDIDKDNKMNLCEFLLMWRLANMGAMPPTSGLVEILKEKNLTTEGNNPPGSAPSKCTCQEKEHENRPQKGIICRTEKCLSKQLEQCYEECPKAKMKLLCPCNDKGEETCQGGGNVCPPRITCPGKPTQQPCPPPAKPCPPVKPQPKKQPCPPPQQPPCPAPPPKQQQQQPPCSSSNSGEDQTESECPEQTCSCNKSENQPQRNSCSCKGTNDSEGGPCGGQQKQNGPCGGQQKQNGPCGGQQKQSGSQQDCQQQRGNQQPCGGNASGGQQWSGQSKSQEGQCGGECAKSSSSTCTCKKSPCDVCESFCQCRSRECRKAKRKCSKCLRKCGKACATKSKAKCRRCFEKCCSKCPTIQEMVCQQKCKPKRCGPPQPLCQEEDDRGPPGEHTCGGADDPTRGYPYPNNPYSTYSQLLGKDSQAERKPCCRPCKEKCCCPNFGAIVCKPVAYGSVCDHYEDVDPECCADKDLCREQELSCLPFPCVRQMAEEIEHRTTCTGADPCDVILEKRFNSAKLECYQRECRPVRVREPRMPPPTVPPCPSYPCPCRTSSKDAGFDPCEPPPPPEPCPPSQPPCSPPPQFSGPTSIQQSVRPVAMSPCKTCMKPRRTSPCSPDPCKRMYVYDPCDSEEDDTCLNPTDNRDYFYEVWEEQKRLSQKPCVKTITLECNFKNEPPDYSSKGQHHRRSTRSPMSSNRMASQGISNTSPRASRSPGSYRQNEGGCPPQCPCSPEPLDESQGLEGCQCGGGGGGMSKCCERPRKYVEERPRKSRSPTPRECSDSERKCCKSERKRCRSKRCR